MIAELALRLRANAGRKILLGSVLSIGFWTTYLLLQRHPLFPARVVKALPIDQWVPFIPGSVYLYESLWLLLPIAPWLMKSNRELGRYTRGLVSISLAGFAIFFFFPTACPRPAPVPDVNLLYRLLIRVDGELHAFPSLHCALAVFHGACCHAVFRAASWPKWLRWVIWIWVAGIIVSTMLTKQHVMLDAAGGIVLGAAGYGLCCRWPRTPESERSQKQA